MTTFWATPQLVSQYAEPNTENVHVQWDEQDNFNAIKSLNGRALGTLKCLEHISRSPKTDITNKTYYLKVTKFNFENLPNIISGIELRLSMQRAGRVTDDTIQICYKDNPIGTNLANLDVSPIKIYGGPTNLWSIENLTPAMVNDISFGIIFRFKAHPKFPHKTGVFVDAVELRIH